MSSGSEIALGICTIFVVLLATSFFSFRDGQNTVRREAIVANVAQWVVDPTSGVTRFEFKK